MTQRQDKSAANARTHPDDRARIAALNAIGQTLRGAPAEKPQTSYYTPLLIQCTLPHSDPKARDVGKDQWRFYANGIQWR